LNDIGLAEVHGCCAAEGENHVEIGELNLGMLYNKSSTGFLFFLWLGRRTSVFSMFSDVQSDYLWASDILQLMENLRK
jgi:hypothetical protein